MIRPREISRFACGAVFGTLLILLFAGSSWAAEDFYSDKRFRIVVGYSPGGGWDTVARVFAKRFSNHLPGKPSVIVMNMPGAAGLIARNTVLGSWKQDGTAMVSMSLSEVPQVAFGEVKPKFDYRKVNWVGSMASEVSICFVAQKTGIENIRTQAIAFGVLGAGSASYKTANFVKSALNPKVKVISGYKGSADVYAAMERGEVDGYCITKGSLLAARPDWLLAERPFVKVLLQLGPKKDPALKGVPHHLDFAKSPEERELFDLAMSDSAYNRPLAMGAGVPPEQVKAVQDAFMKTMRDPAFIAGAERIKQDIEPSAGEEIAKWTTNLLDLPPDKMEILRKWFGS